MKDKECIEYYSTGEIYSKRIYKNGKASEEYISYYKSGRIILERYYDKGQEISKEKYKRNQISLKILEVLK